MGFTSWIKLQFLRMYTTHFWKWGRFVAWLIDSSQRGNYPVAVRVLTRDTRAALHWNEMVMAIPSNPAMSWKIAQHILNELRYSKNLRIFHGVDMCLPPKYRVFPWLLKKKVWNFAAQGPRARWCHDHLQASDWSPSEWPGCHRYPLVSWTWLENPF